MTQPRQLVHLRPGRARLRRGTHRVRPGRGVAAGQRHHQLGCLADRGDLGERAAVRSPEEKAINPPKSRRISDGLSGLS